MYICSAFGIIFSALLKYLFVGSNFFVEFEKMVEELIDKYSKYTSRELLEIRLNISKYSDEARNALELVTQKRGGWEEIEKEVQREKEIDDEIDRVSKEVKLLSAEYTDLEFLKEHIKSDILTPGLLDKIIKQVNQENQKEIEDSKVNSRTIIGSLIGTIIGSILGGIIWGLQLITMGRMFYLLIVLLVLINYGSIKLITRQSKKNIVVVIAVIIGTLLSVWLGFLFYNLFGYQGGDFKLF